MDLKRLSQGEAIAAASAIGLIIVMSFFSWFEVRNDVATALSAAQGFDTTYNAWQAFGFIDIVLLATVIAAVGTAVLRAAKSRAELPLSTVATVLGALSTILLLYRVIDPPNDASREIGVFLGAIFAAAVTIGGWLEMETEAASFEETPDQ